MAGAEARREMLPGVEHDILTWPCMPAPRARFACRLDTISQWGIIGIIARTAATGLCPGGQPGRQGFVIWMNWDSGIDFKRIGTLIK
jgi:hypothetical protein